MQVQTENAWNPADINAMLVVFKLSEADEVSCSFQLLGSLREGHIFAMCAESKGQWQTAAIKKDELVLFVGGVWPVSPDRWCKAEPQGRDNSKGIHFLIDAFE